MQRGIEFEDQVYAACDTDPSCTSATSLRATTPYNGPTFDKVVEACKGGEFQKVFKRKESFAGFTAVYYVKLDVLLPDRIIDIKITENYRGSAKYFNGYQHDMYPWLAGVRKFTYLVAELDKHSDKILDLHELPYEVRKSDEAVISTMRQYPGKLIHGLKARGLYEDYVNIFSNKGGRNNGGK